MMLENSRKKRGARSVGLRIAALLIAASPALLGAVAQAEDIPLVDTSTALFVGVGAGGPVGTPVHVRSSREFQAAFSTPAGEGELWYAVRLFFLNGGRDAWVVCLGATSSAGAAADVAAALEQVTEFSIVCLPGISDPVAMVSVAEYCEAQRAILLLDLPRACDTPAEAARWLSAHSDLKRPNVVAHAPWVKVGAAPSRPPVDVPRRGILRGLPLRSRGRIRLATPAARKRRLARPLGYRAIPPSGAVAGIMARTDRERGVWKAPAGVDAQVRGIAGLVREPRADEIEAFTRLGVNPLRTLQDGRIVVWGSRTLSQNPEWRYVPVRRLFLFIEESISEGTQWAVFEPNDEPLWQSLRLSVGEFMQELYRKGAFQGALPREAYFVKCGTDTMTAADRAQGLCNILVGFAAVRPAEFIIVRIQQKTAAP